MATTVEAAVSRDVLRSILAELDNADGIDDRLGKLDEVLCWHLKVKGCNRQALSKEASDAWDAIEDIDARLLELKATIREALNGQS